MSRQLLCAAGFFAASVMAPFAAAQGNEEKPKQTKESNVVASATYRTSVLSDMDVRNPQGDELGNIDDLVVDLESNQIRYIALSVGGFLGIGDKLVAVPIEAMKLVHDGEETYFVLDADKKSLEEAPGFNEDNWPDVADPRWSEEVDKRFGNIQILRATVQRVEDERVVVKTEDGEEKAITAGGKAVVMIDGEEAELSDLQQGQKLRIQTVEEEGSRVVRSIETRTQKQEQKPRESERE